MNLRFILGTVLILNDVTESWAVTHKVMVKVTGAEWHTA